MLLFLACMAPAKGPADSVSTTDRTTDSTTTTTDSTDSTVTDTQTTDTARELVGQPPENPVPLPEFTATNMDGSPRTSADLLGHRTVIWFYPAAGTFG